MRILAAILATAAVFGVSSQSGAQTNNVPLLPQDVLKASFQHFPAIIESLAVRRGVEAGVLEARGAFDVLIESEGFDYTTGFYSGSALSATATQNLAPLGATVFGGYRLSDGFLPVYEDEYFTNSAGEFKIGTVFSLLRDRSIDSRRFNISDAQLAVEQAEMEVLLTQLGVQYRALTSYWRWVWAGRQLDVYEELLSIAESRQSGIEEEVRAGARAQIFLTENLQNISRRQRLATEARRNYLSAANALSLFYRDSNGDPVVPVSEQLPPANAFAPDENGLAIENVAPEVPQIIGRRPEVAILRTEIERVRNKIELRENDMKPRLDLSAEISRDIGAISEGGSSRDSTDTIVGFRFTVPFQRREAKGRLRRAEAELDAAVARRRQLEDELEIQVRDILINLDVTAELVDIAGQEVEQSLAMQTAEQQRFRSGASDFFLVNVREETAADARIRYFLSILERRLARANYDAAILNLERFGISPGSMD
ncbi:MAG: TolC family protein [Pseudomonadota bacterium]